MPDIIISSTVKPVLSGHAIGPLHSGLYREVVFEYQVKIYYADSFWTSRSGLLIQVVSEYRWPLTQVSLYILYVCFSVYN